MSTNVGSIHYDLSLNTAPFDEAVKSIADKTKKVGDKISSIGKKMSVAITLPVVAGFGAAIKAASDLNETLNKVDVAFGDQSKAVKDWSKTSIKSMGLAQQSALDAAALFGDMSTSMGLNTEAAADMSTKLVQLGGDLSSFKNISFEETQTALSGIFTGETESLKRLGIVMTDTNVKSFAMTNGFKGNWMELSQSEKVMWRYKYVMSVTKNAQGDFTRTSDGAANQTRMTGERVKQLSADLGQKLLPAYQWLLKVGNDVIDWFDKLDDGQKQTILTTLGVAAAVGPLLIVLGTLASSLSSIITGVGAVTGAMKVLWLTMLSHPVFLVISAVAALVVGLGLLSSSNSSAASSSDRLASATDRVRQATEELKLSEQTLVDARLAQTGANLAVERAVLTYNAAVKQFGPDSLEAREAEYQLAAAREWSKKKTEDVMTAEQTRNEKLTGKEAAKAQEAAIRKEEKVGNAVASVTEKIENQINKWGTLNTSLSVLNGKNFSYNVTGTSVGTDIPGNANGTNYWKGGLSWVGERGPELVNLPKGSQVIPNHELGSVGGNTSIYGNITIGSQETADYFFSRLSNNQQLSSKGLASGIGTI